MHNSNRLILSVQLRSLSRYHNSGEAVGGPVDPVTCNVHTLHSMLRPLRHTRPRSRRRHTPRIASTAFSRRARPLSS